MARLGLYQTQQPGIVCSTSHGALDAQRLYRPITTLQSCVRKAVPKDNEAFLAEFAYPIGLPHWQQIRWRSFLAVLKEAVTGLLLVND